MPTHAATSKLQLTTSCTPAAELVAGTVLGLGIASAVTRLMGELLYGVSPTDPLTFGSVIGMIALVGFAACRLPARRAARLDPLNALRHE
jgi:ABC-type lipoprotein release transport system permease subunit